MSLVLGPMSVTFHFYVAKLTLDDNGDLDRDYYTTAANTVRDSRHRVELSAHAGDVLESCFNWQSESNSEPREPVYELVTQNRRLKHIGCANDSLATARIIRYLHCVSYLRDWNFHRAKITVEGFATMLGKDINCGDAPIGSDHFSALYKAWKACLDDADIAAFDAKLFAIFDSILQEHQRGREEFIG